MSRARRTCWVGWLALVALLSAARSGSAACAKDTDCKGDRVCNAGQCVSPSAAPPAAPAPSSCAKDTDCKGDRVCSAGQCVAPSAAGTPSAAPPAAEQQPVPPPVPPPSVPPPAATPEASAAPPPPPAPAPRGGGGGGGGISRAVPGGCGGAVGQAEQNDNFSDEASGMIPLWWDAGYLINPHIFVGLYFQYGFGLTTSKSFGGKCNGASLPAGVQESCSAHDTRFGAEFHYHFIPRGPFDPWIGAGFGYEWASESISSMGKSASQGLDGFELINLQAGGDFKLNPSVGIGPFVAVAVGQFGNQNQDTSQIGGSKVSGSISDKTLHEWVFVGLRGVFDVHFH